MNGGRRSGGQSIIEYVIIIGIAVMALYAMGPSFRRGVQSVIKSTADQLAPQKNAEQDFSSDTSHLDSSATKTNATVSRNTQELLYSTTTTSDESASTLTNTVTNSGFSQQ